MSQVELIDSHEELQGESPPIEPRAFAVAVRDYFESSVENVQGLTPDGHELITSVEGQVLPAEGLKFKLRRAGNFAVEHKTEIIVASAAVVTVAGLLKARQKLRLRKR